MRTLKLTIVYDGTPFVGWQRQGSGTSIQGLIEGALGRLDGAPVAVVGAGRTDAGVHAYGQVASARLSSSIDLPELWRAVNALLPAEVCVVGLEEAPADFHARYGARAKRYAYRIVTGPLVSPFDLRYAWHITRALDVASMSRALGSLVGTHDFAAFQAAGSRVRDTVRTIHEAGIGEDGRALGSRLPALAEPLSPEPGAWSPCPLVVHLRGDGFLRHMVRTIVGTLVDIGRGRWPPEEMAAILASRDRRRAGPTAPPQGLFLVRVFY